MHWCYNNRCCLPPMLSLSFTGILGNTPDPGVPDSGSYPTQNLTPVPYAIQALNATTATTVTAATSANSAAAANIVGTLALSQVQSAVVTNNQTGVKSFELVGSSRSVSANCAGLRPIGPIARAPDLDSNAPLGNRGSSRRRPRIPSLLQSPCEDEFALLYFEAPSSLLPFDM